MAEGVAQRHPRGGRCPQEQLWPVRAQGEKALAHLGEALRVEQGLRVAQLRHQLGGDLLGDIRWEAAGELGAQGGW